MQFQPLLADFGEVIGLIIWVVIIGFSIISKIMNAAKGQPAAKRPPKPPAAPRADRPAGKGIESEIEEFLRQARGQQEKPVPRPPAARQMPDVQARREFPPPGAKPRRVVRAAPIQAVPVEALPLEDDIVPGKRFGKDLSEHVADHIGRDSISTRDSGLGDVVSQADERIENHLEQVFDHDVGRLAHSEMVDTSVAEGTDARSWEETADDKSMTAAGKIRKMLRSPESIREVYIISEILKRPE